MERKIVSFVNLLARNWLSRRLICKLDHFDETTGEMRVEKVLKRYVGESTSFDMTCRVYYPFVRRIVAYGGKRFEVSEERMKEFFSDPIKRKGLGNVVLSIAKYGITKPQKLRAPFLVVWDITKACNLKCKHCYSSSGRRSRDELNTEDVKRIIDEMDRMGIVAIAFSGGEPLMRPDFYDIAAYASRKNIYTAIATNGTLIDKNVAKKVKKAGIRYVEISIDGADPATHDSFRGVDGAWEKAVEGIKNCKNMGLMTAIASTATTSNIDEIGQIIDLAEDIGVDRFIEFNFIPTGRGRFSLEADLSPTQREGLLKYLYERSQTSPVEIFSTAPQYARIAIQTIHKHGGGNLSFTFYGGHVEGDLFEIAEFISGCGAGRLYCAVTSSGKVKPCVFMPIVVGNLRKESLYDVWNNSQELKDLRDRSKIRGRCAQCTYKYVCGGCRSRAYGYYGDMEEVDTGCIYNDNAYKEIMNKN
ncbi:MAG TPA: radical SAM protein, partial [Methanomicrobia archaeon]|nr:radical SAM protein [Methanomicrobia archaeon]